MNTLMYVTMLLLIFIVMKKNEKFSLITYLTTTIVFVNGLVSAFFPQQMTTYLSDNALTSALPIISLSSMSTLVVALLSFYFVMEMKLGSLVKLIRGLVYVAVLNAVLLIVHSFFMKAPFGLLMTSTMDGMFLGIIYPLIVLEFMNKRILNFIVPLIVIIAIFLTTSSIGIGALCLSMYLPSAKDKVWKFVAIIPPLLLFTLALFLYPSLLSDSLRFINWKWSMTWWWENANIYTGTGLGSYKAITAYVQQVTGNMSGVTANTIYPFMHNDWLQCLFELGIVGFVLVLLSFLNVLYKLRSSPYIFATSLSYGVCAFLNFPVHNPITILLGLSLLKITEMGSNES